MLYITGIVIAFFLAGLLLSKKNKSIADKLLSVWLVFIGVHLVFFYLGVTGKIYQAPWLLGWTIPLPLVHGPFLYLYSAALIKRLPANRKLMLLHFIPAVACYLYMVKFFVLSPEKQIFIFQHKGIGFETFMKINLVAIIISGLTYITLTNVLLMKHRAAILDQFSSTEKINLKWLQYLSIGIAAIWLSVIAGTDELTFGTVVLFVVFMGYFGIKQVGIFTETVPQKVQEKMVAEGPAEENFSAQTEDQAETLADPTLETADKRKYSKSGLSEGMAESLHRELALLMDKDKIFAESELSLADLAKLLNAHPNYLSQVINEKEGKNFYDYVNTLRIAEFKRLVTNPANQKFTILSLAYEAGFNSKSSFNRYFKKETGQSPSEYLRSMNLQEQ